jgi:hypothetical protein
MKNGLTYRSACFLPLHALVVGSEYRLSLNRDLVKAQEVGWLLERDPDDREIVFSVPGTHNSGEIGVFPTGGYVTRLYGERAGDVCEVRIEPTNPDILFCKIGQTDFVPSSPRQPLFSQELCVFGNIDHGFSATFKLARFMPIGPWMANSYVLLQWKILVGAAQKATETMSRMKAVGVAENDALFVGAVKFNRKRSNGMLRNLKRSLPGLDAEAFSLTDPDSLNDLKQRVRAHMPDHLKDLFDKPDEIPSECFMDRFEINLGLKQGGYETGVGVVPINLVFQTRLGWEGICKRVVGFFKQNLGFVPEVLEDTKGRERTIPLNNQPLGLEAYAMHLEGLPQIVSSLEIYNRSFLQLIKPWQKGLQTFARSGEEAACFAPVNKRRKR